MISADGYLHCKGGCGSKFKKVEPLKRHEAVCDFAKLSSPAAGAAEPAVETADKSGATAESGGGGGGLKLTPVSKLTQNKPTSNHPVKSNKRGRPKRSDQTVPLVKKQVLYLKPKAETKDSDIKDEPKDQ